MEEQLEKFPAEELQRLVAKQQRISVEELFEEE